MRCVFFIVLLLSHLRVSSQDMIDSTDRYMIRSVMKHQLGAEAYFQLAIDDQKHVLSICQGGTRYRSMLYFDSTCSDINEYSCYMDDTLATTFPLSLKLDWGSSRRLDFKSKRLTPAQLRLTRTLFGKTEDIKRVWIFRLDDDAMHDLLVLRQVVEQDAASNSKVFDRLELYLNRGETYIKVLEENFKELPLDVYISAFTSFGLPAIMYSKYAKYWDGEMRYRFYVTRLNKKPESSD